MIDFWIINGPEHWTVSAYYIMLTDIDPTLTALGKLSSVFLDLILMQCLFYNDQKIMKRTQKMLNGLLTDNNFNAAIWNSQIMKSARTSCAERIHEAMSSTLISKEDSTQRSPTPSTDYYTCNEDEFSESQYQSCDDYSYESL
ncbi:hypothetical protein MAM1_0128c06060 [Mucor ambiguus]|uniref:Uncharacterized protein n=1 Tax=Mucor ambiguus TaxID=91626 RepID=A0A0C9MGX6_9FUNG|nr:hypothetical protein MAM1_0128c06060 [Mucor ambiguus]